MGCRGWSGGWGLGWVGGFQCNHRDSEKGSGSTVRVRRIHDDDVIAVVFILQVLEPIANDDVRTGVIKSAR